MAFISRGIWRWKEHSRKQMDGFARQMKEGQTMHLRHGVTHFQLDDTTDLPLLVCIHGWSTASYVWEPLRPMLQQEGYRVLTYDLFGRGFSDRPAHDNTAEFFCSQLNELLDRLSLNGQPLSIVGYSMGGAIAARFVSRRLEQIERLLLIAPAGMSVRAPWLRRILRKHPKALDPHALALLPPLLRAQFRKEAAPYWHNPLVRKVARCQFRELDYRGYLPSLVSSLNGVLSSKMQQEHLAIVRSGIPVRAIFAEDDTTIPRKDAKPLFDRWHGDGVSEIVYNAGHGVTYTRPEDVMDIARGIL